MERIQTAAERQALLASSMSPTNCTCSLGACAGWESLSEYRWPKDAQQIATLRDPELYEPTFEELHPQGTRYESPDAPVAVNFFPYNRCDLWKCHTCKRHLLRYTEYGGYNVDPRVRALDPNLTFLD